MKESKKEECLMLNNEHAILTSNVRLPYNPKTIDGFLDSHKWCRTAKFNFK